MDKIRFYPRAQYQISLSGVQELSFSRVCLQCVIVVLPEHTLFLEGY